MIWHRRSRASRLRMSALRKMMTGLLLDKSSGTNAPPLVVTSAASRPARDTRTVEYPAPARIRTSSTAPASEAPPSRPGTTTSTVVGALVARGASALTDMSSELSGDGADAGKLDMSVLPRRRLSSGLQQAFL